jgi:hypothetical protein
VSILIGGSTARGGSKATPLRLLIAAIAVGGASGYLITWLVPRSIGFAAYPPFAAFWGYLFLLISALSGIQQEVTRATGAAEAGGRKRWPLVSTAAILASSVAILVLVTAPTWEARAFPSNGWGLVWPLVVGAAAYVGEALVFGSLYGLGAWTTLVWIISAESLIRLTAIIIVLDLTSSVEALAWAVALPIPLALCLTVRGIRRAFSAGMRLDVGIRRLVWNLARTIVAAASMGVLVSGLPLVMAMTSPDEPSASLGRMIGAATLTRAPIVVVGVALQAYLIVQFKGSGSQTLKHVSRLTAGLLGVAVALAALAFVLGPAVFGWLFPNEQVPTGVLLAALVASSALVGVLCLTGPAVLASGRHFAYGLGWLLTAVATVVVLATPAPFETRVLVALLVAPVVGIAVHFAVLLVDHRRARFSPIAGAVRP